MFEIGEKVMCVGRGGNWLKYVEIASSYGCELPLIGSVYTIRAINVYSDRTLLRFEEIVNPIPEGFSIEPGCHSAAFRKLPKKKADISIFREMLNPKVAEFQQ